MADFRTLRTRLPIVLVLALTVCADGSVTQTLSPSVVTSSQSPAFAADEAIAFQSDRDGDLEIYVTGVDGAQVTQLTDNEVEDQGPAWSPDGTKMAFATDRDGNFDIYVMNADGTEPTRVTNDPSDEGSPAWSPDGTQIAFSTERDGNFDIYVMNADGTEPTRVTSHPADDLAPNWSPD